MNALRMMAPVLVALGLVASVQAEDKKGDTTKEKLVGTWEITKGEEGIPPPGTVLAFGKDGKLTVTQKKEEKELTAEGTYSVDGDKITVTVKRGGKENTHVLTVKKLTDTEFAAVNEQGKMLECKKKK